MVWFIHLLYVLYIPFLKPWFHSTGDLVCKENKKTVANDYMYDLPREKEAAHNIDPCEQFIDSRFTVSL